MPETPTWGIPPHTKAKHVLLGEYLKAWFPIMATNRPVLQYVDGFAGPGIYDGGEPGSPIVALRTLLDHTALGKMDNTEFRFRFIEQDEKRAQILEGQVREQGALPPNVNVRVLNESFFDVALKHVDGNVRLPATLAFVDPFGFKDVPLRLISGLLRHPSCELLFNFMEESINRFAGKGTAAEANFSDLFACEDYRSAPADGPERHEFLVDLYHRQLTHLGNFKHVRDFEMVNDRGRTGNRLFFGTRHDLGLTVMKTAMWKVDPRNGTCFSANQETLLTLFGNEPDIASLQEQIYARFRATTATIEEIEAFVLGTNFDHRSHLKRLSLKPMEDDGRITEVVGRKGKVGYPPHTRITFRP